MQNNNYLSRDKTQALIDELGVTKDEGPKFLQGLADKGFTVEGYNDKKPEPTNFLDKVKQEVDKVSTQYQTNVGQAEAAKLRGEQTGFETTMQKAGEAAQGFVKTALSPLTVGIESGMEAAGMKQALEEANKQKQAYSADNCWSASLASSPPIPCRAIFFNPCRVFSTACLVRPEASCPLALYALSSLP